MSTATKTKKLRTVGVCSGCKREFTANSCKRCGRPFDDATPDPKTVRDLRARIAERDAEIRQLRALDPTHGLDRENREAVRRLIGVLVELAEAGDPTPGSMAVAQIRVKHADSTADPGASTRWARRLNRKILAAIKAACDEYEAHKDGTWKPPVRDLVRCVNEKCKLYGKRFDRWMKAGSSMIEFTHCPNVECGNRLTRA